MTGFGRGKAAGLGIEIAVELSSVNRRTLEINTSVPKEWQGLERPLIEQIRAALNRGAVRAVVTVQSEAGANALEWDQAAVDQTLDRLQAIAQVKGHTASVDLDTLLKVVLLHRKEGGLPELEDAAPLLEKATAAALTAFSEMRAAEGAALAQDLIQRSTRLQEILTGIIEVSANTVTTYRETLHARLRQAGLELELQDERVLKEIAIFADRADTTEEQTRLSSHLSQFSATVGNGDGEPIGRKLEFILQEINREFNTIGSKANNIEVSKLVIEAKNEIERIREQVQNIE